MHELSLAASLVNTIEEAAKLQQFSNVKTVYVEVGALSCVDTEALRFALASTCHTPLLQQAKFAIKTIHGQLQCQHCQTVFNSDELYQSCPSCQQYGAKVIAGDDTRLTSLDVY